MPYIPQVDRDIYAVLPDDAGQLNYAISNLVNTYLERHLFNYQTINDIVGALEGAKAEFQRRVVSPYEDAKRISNGDVYTKEFV